MIRRRWMRLPKLVRFMLMHIANGMVLGCVFVFGLIWFDVGGLARLLARMRAGSRPSCCSSRRR